MGGITAVSHPSHIGNESFKQNSGVTIPNVKNAQQCDQVIRNVLKSYSLTLFASICTSQNINFCREWVDLLYMSYNLKPVSKYASGVTDFSL